MEKIKRLLSISLVALSLLSPEASAGVREDNGNEYSASNEIEVSVGLPFPQFASSLTGVTTGFAKIFGHLSSVPWSSSDITPVEHVYGESIRTPVIRLEYGKNINGWLNVGGGAYYSYSSCPQVYSETGAPAWSEEMHSVSVMVNVRFYWLNRRLVRMYSGLGGGVGIVFSNLAAGSLEESGAMRTYIVPALDVRLVGLTVGRRLYGRFEAGVLGTGLVTAGIGYRF